MRERLKTCVACRTEVCGEIPSEYDCPSVFFRKEAHGCGPCPGDIGLVDGFRHFPETEVRCLCLYCLYILSGGLAGVAPSPDPDPTRPSSP